MFYHAFRMSRGFSNADKRTLPPTLEDVAEEIIKKFKLDKKHLFSHKIEHKGARKTQNVMERIVFSAEMNKRGFALLKIANYLGLSNHTSIHHYLKKAQDYKFTKDRAFMKYYRGL